MTLYIFASIDTDSPIARQLFAVQVLLLVTTGLDKKLSRFFVITSGTTPVDQTIVPTDLLEKTTFINTPVNVARERFALASIWSVASAEESQVLHLGENWSQWHHVIQYFTPATIVQIQDLLETGIDVIAPALIRDPLPRYQSEFWWARSAYLKTLSTPRQAEPVDDPDRYFTPPPFDWKWYQSNHPDLRVLEGQEAVTNHWEKNGRLEGRQGFDPSDAKLDWKWYRQIHPDLHHLTTKEQLLQHWRDSGRGEDRSRETEVEFQRALLRSHDKLWLTSGGGEFRSI